MRKNITLALVLVLVIGMILFGCNKKQEAQKEQTGQESQSTSQEKPVPPGEIHAAHILIMYKGSDRAPANVMYTKDEARLLAADLRKRLQDGANFAELARTYSNCPSAKNGGDLGTFGRGMMVAEFESAAFSLKKGATSDVVETQFGFHIIKRLR